MAKKHRNYQPQQRKSHESVPIPEQNTLDVGPVSPEQTMAKLTELFNIDEVIAGDLPATFTGSLMATVIASLELVEWDGNLARDEMQAVLPELVVAIRFAATKLKAQGFDRTNSHEIIPRLSAVSLYTDAASKQVDNIKFVQKMLHANPDELIGDEITHDLVEGLESAAYMRLLRIYMMSKRMAIVIQQSEVEFGIYENLRANSIRRLEQEMASNPNTVRRETTAALNYLFSDEVTSMLNHFGYQDEPINRFESNDDPMDLPHQELDFTVLPAGDGLDELIEAIAGRLSEKEREHVDINRIRVLHMIREFVGKERCYIAHGKKSGRQMIDADSDTAIDEDYIVLVMQNLGDGGVTRSEDALAISPIARKHAAYLVRQDSSAGSWRELLSLPKRESQYYGARDLRFTGSSGRTPYAMMEEKIKALLTCNPDDFHNKLRMRSDGTYRLENLQRDIGTRATSLLVGLM